MLPASDLGSNTKKKPTVDSRGMKDDL